jgi:TRAP-type uncharacterized transport system substrate-binding protein
MGPRPPESKPSREVARRRPSLSTQLVRSAGIGLIALAALLAISVITLLWEPAPPSRLVMSSGAEGGGYHHFAQHYQTVLARHGITLEVRPSSGAIDNLERLRKPGGGVDVALIQGGIAREADQAGLTSLGHMFLVALGEPGSGTHRVAQDMLRLYRLDGQATTTLELGGLAAAQALKEGRIDAAFFVASEESPVVMDLFNTPGIHITSIRRAEALVRRFAHLRKIALPTGVIDPGADLPGRDVMLVGTTAQLVAREGLHPVIAELLIDAAREVHGKATLLAPAGSFPNAEPGDFALSTDAHRLYKEGTGPLRRYLPLWAAVWVQRIVFIVLPLLAILAPVAHFVPVLWRWHMRRRIHQWYGEVRYIEDATLAGQGNAREQLQRLHQIDDRLRALRVPTAFDGELFSLRSHVHLVHNLLEASIARDNASAG